MAILTAVLAARVFDPASGRVVEDAAACIEGERISAVKPTRELPAGEEYCASISATGH